MTRKLKLYTGKYHFNTKESSYGEIKGKDKRDKENKQQKARHKSYFISYIKCKWTKHSNQKAEVGQMDFKKHN